MTPEQLNHALQDRTDLAMKELDQAILNFADMKVGVKAMKALGLKGEASLALIAEAEKIMNVIGAFNSGFEAGIESKKS